MSDDVTSSSLMLHKAALGQTPPIAMVYLLDLTRMIIISLKNCSLLL